MNASRDATHPNEAAFPRIGGPALRALRNAKVRSVEELSDWSEGDLAELHGMGPKALGLLRAALEARGQRFRAP